MAPTCYVAWDGFVDRWRIDTTVSTFKHFNTVTSPDLGILLNHALVDLATHGIVANIHIEIDRESI